MEHRRHAKWRTKSSIDVLYGVKIYEVEKELTV